MASLVYNNAKMLLATSGIDWDTHTFKVALVTSAYTPDKDTHLYFSSVTGEVVGTGYTAGGAALAGLTVTVDNTNDWAVLHATDSEWTGATFTARAAVVYRVVTNAADSPLVTYIDFGSDQTVFNAPFTIQWATAGILSQA